MIKIIEHSNDKNFSISEFSQKYQVVISSKEKEFQLESFKKINMKEISTFIELIIEKFENFLISINLKSLSTVCGCDGVFKLKVWSGFSKFRFLAAFQNENNRRMDIFIKNGYETFGSIKKN